MELIYPRPSWPADITSERAKDFGASAPVTNPQKTGTAHSSATSSEVVAAFVLNGQSLGELREFLDRAAALDHSAGRPRGVEGLRTRLHTGPIESE